MKKLRDVCLAMVLSALFPTAQIQLQSRAQDKPAVHVQPPATEGRDAAHGESGEKPKDSLGRSTPHGTVFGFLQTAQNGKYKEAAEYLQLSNYERITTGPELARKLSTLMDTAFLGRVGALRNQPEAPIQPGVSPDHAEIGVFRLNGTETPVELVRVSDPRAGDIWLFSSETIAQVSGLSEQIESDRVGSYLPKVLSTRIFRTPLWRWIAFLLLIPIAFGVTWVIAKVVGKGRRLWLRSRHYPVIEDIHASLTRPIVLILTVSVHRIAMRFLGVPLLFRLYYERVSNIILVAGIAWLAFQIVKRWGEGARRRALASSKDRSGSIVVLGQRILKVLVVIIAGLSILSILGFNLTTAIAGLGIGSIALAFAAQKTLENLLGGVSIIGDQVVRVGETCRIADQLGTVEGISLRSTRLRTLAGTELSVPNGQLANMNLENLSRRAKFLFEIKIGLLQETSPAQLRSFLTDVRVLLRADARVGEDNLRVHFVGIGESSFDLEIFCYILTGDLGEFFAIREDLLLGILDLMTAKGIGLAMPARTLHLMREQKLKDQGMDQPRFDERRRAA